MTKIKVCTLEELPVGKARRVSVASGWDIGVFRTGEGVRAIDNRCPHAGVPLHTGYLENGEIVCPMHLWSFSLDSGLCTTFPGPAVETYPTEVRDGTIFILLDEDGEDSQGEEERPDA